MARDAATRAATGLGHCRVTHRRLSFRFVPVPRLQMADLTPEVALKAMDDGYYTEDFDPIRELVVRQLHAVRSARVASDRS